MSHLQYRYHVEALARNPARQTARLNELGMGGWRLVAVSGGKAYFIHATPSPEGRGARALEATTSPAALEPPKKQLGEGRAETP